MILPPHPTDRAPAPATLRLWLPQPPKLLHPNVHTRSPAATWRVTKKYRKAVALIGLAAVQLEGPGFPWPGATVFLDYHFKDRRSRHDGDNLVAWMKAGLDGLTDGGLWVDDRHVTISGVGWNFGTDHAGRVELIMERKEAEE